MPVLVATQPSARHHIRPAALRVLVGQPVFHYLACTKLTPLWQPLLSPFKEALAASGRK
jgi:hypothetical protein